MIAYLKVLVFCLFSFLSAAFAANPNREFSVDRTEGYGPLTVTFDASNIKPAKKYYWTLGNGETLTTTNSIVTYSYKAVGGFTASLKFAVNASDKDLKNLKDAGTVLIKVLNQPNPTPNLAPVANISCTTNNLLINCNGLSSYDPEGQPLSFKFDFGDGAMESNTSGLSSHAYAVAGLYSVTLTVTDSAGASSAVFTQVQALKPANKLPALNLACSSDAINTLSCNATGSADLDGSIVSFQYAWDDNATDSKADSSSITHVFTGSGNHTVILTATDNDGGVSVLTKSFTVKANTNPVAAFTCDTSKPEKVICSSTSSDSDVGDSIQSYSWKFGENSAISTTTPNTDYDFKAGGTFDVTLVVTDSYGGTGSLTQSVVVKSNIAPVAAFTCSNTGIGAIHCESNATDADGLIVSSNWSLDDGSSFEGLTIDHKFSSGVEHTISLTVMDDLGSRITNSKTVQLTINQLPTFDFISNVVTGTAPLAVHFQIQNSADIDGTIASTSLNFGDNTSSALADVTHSYSSAGTYTVTAKVTDDLGGVTTKTKQIIVQAQVIVSPPQAYFKYFQDGTYLELHANITKTQYDIKRAFYTVDGSQTIELLEFYPNTINTVDVGNFGLHTIKLTVIDTTGQTGVFTHSFELKEDLSQVQPFVTFNVRQSSPRTVFVNMNGAFTSDFDEDIEHFHVEYGNGFSEDIYDDTFATYTYPQAGSYLIKVTAVTTRQTQAAATRNITITNNEVAVVQPVAAFAYNIYQFAQNVTFYNERSGSPNGGIISYLWDFGDGSTGTGELAAHFYNPGSYFVKLTVTDFAGFTSSQTQHITIVGAGDDIAANISCWDVGDLKIGCNFVALDKLNQINRVKVIWGDGTNNILSTAAIPEYGFYEAGHTYAAAGDKTIQLFVGTSRGVSKTISIVKNVVMPIAPPLANVACSTQGLYLTCNSIGSYDPQSLPLLYTYDFGDGESLTTAETSVNHQYTSGGAYNIQLTATNSAGMSGHADTSVNAVAIINQTPIAMMNCQVQTNKVVCDSLASFDPDGSIVNAHWDFGDGSSADGLMVEHLYSSFGQYTVTLTVTDNSFSDANSFQIIPINGAAPVALADCAVLNQVLNCNAIKSYDPDGNIVEYNWKIGEDVSLKGRSINYEFISTGLKTVSLTVVDNSGNQAILSLGSYDITNRAPVASIACSKVSESLLSCFGDSSYDDGRITSYKWEFDGKIYFGENQNFTVNTDGDFKIKLTVLDAFGEFSSTETSYEMAPSVSFNSSIGRVRLSDQDQEPFYPYKSTIKFSIDQTRLNQNFTNNIIQLNGVLLDPSSVIYNFISNSVNLNLELKDGPNELTFNLTDDLDKKIDTTIIIYSGKKTLHLDLIDENGISVSRSVLRLSPMDSSKELIKVIATSNKLDIENVPALDIFIHSNSGSLQGSNVAYSNVNDLQIKHHGWEAVSGNQNGNFENGIDGWNIGDSGSALENNELSIFPNSAGIVTLRKAFRVGNESGIVTFENAIFSSFGDDYYSLTMRNKSTGEIVEDFNSTESLGIVGDYLSSPSRSVPIKKSIKTISSDDIVELEFKFFTKHTVNTVTKLDKLYSLFFKDANAQSGDVGFGHVISNGHFTPDFQIVNPSIFKANGEPLALLSIGGLPIYEDGTMPFQYNGQPSNPLKVSFELFNEYDAKIISSTLNIYGCVDNDCNKNDHLRAHDLILQKIEENKFTGAVRILSDWDFSTYNKVKITVKLENELGDIDELVIENQFNFNKDDLHGLTFNTLVSASSRGYLYGDRDLTISDRFSLRDSEKGGDDWIRPQMLNLIRPILGNYTDRNIVYVDQPEYGYEQNLINVLKKDKIQSFLTNNRINDLSNMNGGKTDHTAHQKGTSIDARFDFYSIDQLGITTDESDFINPELELPGKKAGVTNQNITDKIDTRFSAYGLIDLLNKSELLGKIKLIYATYKPISFNHKPETVDLRSEFQKTIETACLKNGYMGNEIIQNWKNHFNHYHIELEEGYLKGEPKLKQRTNINICTKVEQDNSGFKIKDCANNADIKINDYIVLGKLPRESELKWIELRNDGAKFILDQHLKNQVASLRIIYKGNSAKGCGFTDRETIDTRTTDINGKTPFGYDCKVENDYGHTFWGIDRFTVDHLNLNSSETSNLTTLFVGEKSKIDEIQVIGLGHYVDASSLDEALFHSGNIFGYDELKYSQLDLDNLTRTNPSKLYDYNMMAKISREDNVVKGKISYSDTSSFYFSSGIEPQKTAMCGVSHFIAPQLFYSSTKLKNTDVDALVILKNSSISDSQIISNRVDKMYANALPIENSIIADSIIIDSFISNSTISYSANKKATDKIKITDSQIIDADIKNSLNDPERGIYDHAQIHSLSSYYRYNSYIFAYQGTGRIISDSSVVKNSLMAGDSLINSSLLNASRVFARTVLDSNLVESTFMGKSLDFSNMSKSDIQAGFLGDFSGDVFMADLNVGVIVTTPENLDRFPASDVPGGNVTAAFINNSVTITNNAPINTIDLSKNSYASSEKGLFDLNLINSSAFSFYGEIRTSNFKDSFANSFDNIISSNFLRAIDGEVVTSQTVGSQASSDGIINLSNFYGSNINSGGDILNSTFSVSSATIGGSFVTAQLYYGSLVSTPENVAFSLFSGAEVNSSKSIIGQQIYNSKCSDYFDPITGIWQYLKCTGKSN